MESLDNSDMLIDFSDPPYFRMAKNEEESDIFRAKWAY